MFQESPSSIYLFLLHLTYSQKIFSNCYWNLKHGIYLRMWKRGISSPNYLLILLVLLPYALLLAFPGTVFFLGQLLLLFHIVSVWHPPFRPCLKPLHPPPGLAPYLSHGTVNAALSRHLAQWWPLYKTASPWEPGGAYCVNCIHFWKSRTLKRKDVLPPTRCSLLYSVH